MNVIAMSVFVVVIAMSVLLLLGCICYLVFWC